MLKTNTQARLAHFIISGKHTLQSNTQARATYRTHMQI